MTGDQLYTLNTELLGGLEINETLFYDLLNTSRINRENERPWRALRKLDSSQSITSSNVYTTEKDLPADFRRLVPPVRRNDREISPVQLVSGDIILHLTEISYEERETYKNSAGYFYINQLTGKISFTGYIDRTYTVHIWYIHNPGDIEAATEWVFPDEYHRLLAYDAAAQHQLGVDYDDQNARMGNSNAIMAERLAKSMRKWDNDLTLSVLGH